MTAKPKPVVADVVRVYLAERVARGEIRRITAQGMDAPLQGFARVCGRRPVDKLSKRDVERYMETIGTRLAPASRRNHLFVISGFCDWLVDRKLLRSNPTRTIERPRVPRRNPRAIEADQVARLLSMCADTRARLIVMLMVQEGLRCAEVCMLEVGDISWQHQTLRVVGKGGHERYLPITDETRETLDGYLAEHPATTGPLIRSFSNPDRGIRPGTLSHYLAAWMLDAGVKRSGGDGVSGHALRHTAATDMLRNGAHLRDVQHALGHAHLVTTERYLPQLVGDLREAMGGRRYRGAR